LRSAEVDRRKFLARLGLVGAVAGGTIVIPVIPVVAGADPRDLADVLDILPAADPVTVETFNGLAAFIAPGNDVYSTVQGTPRTEPGGVAARTPELLIAMFDFLLPAPGGWPAVIPLSDLIGLMLNLVAPVVNPGSVLGPFPSAFANLFAPEKAVVFSLLENPPPPLLEAITAQVPEPLRPAFGGLLPYLTGGLLAYPALGTYSEFSTFDPATGTLRGRPVGWDISRFDPGVMDGWNDFRGYYQNRQEVHD
jgi:hypothetical protein